MKMTALMAVSSPPPTRSNVLAMMMVTMLLLLISPSTCEEQQQQQQQLVCATGWGSGGDQVILPEQINDGYCDCPLDGADEPDTQACSGSATWPGIKAAPESSTSLLLLFSCPQQPNLKLPPSRVNDGICDCCDGADERNNNNDDDDNNLCQDICDEVLKAEREAKAKAIKNFAVGANRRGAELATFQKVRADKLAEVQDLEDRLAALSDTAGMESELEQLKLNYVTERLATMKEVAAGGVVDMTAGGVVDIVGALDADELAAFVVHACQVDGELSEADDEDHTCVSLRLAGLDAGMMWADDNYNGPRRMKVQRNRDESSPLADLATILFENGSSDDASKKWKMHQIRNGGRRRLDDMGDYMGDDYLGDHEMYDDYDHEPYDDDDYVHHREEADVSWELATGKMGDAMKAVQDTPFSKIRMVFVDRAKEVLDSIAKALGSGNNDEENADAEADAAEGETEEETEPADFDPAAYSMVRTSLRRNGNAIMKGLKWGASAKIFFEGNDDFTEDELRQLAIGTVYHGSLTSLHVWQILQSIVPELRGADAPEESCASPWTAACPPKSIQRDGKAGSFPPALLLESAEKFCAQEAELAMQGKECEDSSAIPESIPPTGYYGYTLPIARDGDDALSQFFEPMNAVSVDKDRADALRKELDDLQRQKSDLESSIINALREVGGRDGNELGPGGELFALADKCFDITAGKYTYEVCVFGKAAQKDKPGPGGTNLGQYTRMDMDDETGERVLYWEGGAKCWNGPKRSATVYVTCGAETTIISADEPETCKYVFEMESHIACDDLYKKNMGLE
eukprot:CAMPEP_0117085172 /NCGR_PEP_ID=MMETSP0472-20121206/59904_1 /TAXON_ID=693140 ORGANISM="Tiarina fusus, Strain LIS" /NCGR_SAMPLE_ID=MMETSP0472 /ASSEMBLY_ACC=CAM_ASM_000603 /LENGTH=802 /DNA_ID=CAMNT_0004814379 /DNA_START=185 /DNA_END=2594 /DNA_ORIENTATION=-